MADNVRSVRALAPEIALVDEPEFAFNLIAADTIRDASYDVLADLPSAENAAISGRAGPVFHFAFTFEDWLPIGREHEGPYAVDTIPANTTTTEVLSVPGSRSSTIDTIGDFDFFRVTLEAGFTYAFACNNAGGGGGLTDPSLALYDAAGTLITLDDDSGPGFNALITYTAPTSGVYYLGANGIPTSTGNYVLTAAIVGGPDSIPGDATTTSTLTIDGPAAASAIDLAGDQDWYAITLVAGESYSFSLTGQGGTPLTDAFLSLYSASGQLLSVDDDGGDGLSSLMQYTATASGTYYLSAGGWETTVGGYSVSAAHGPPQDPLDTLDLGFAFGAANISFYFAVTGETHGPTGQALRDWTAAEQASVTSALATISNVANITFTQVATAAEADFIFALTDLETGVLGQTWPDTSIAYMEFAPDGSGWSPAGLQPGGLGYSVVIHEVGHALGLDHPHLDGGDTQVMQGVTDIFDDYGDFLLNQQIFTIMSYNDGWPAEGIFGGTSGGNVSTPMALDIAALQLRYGANLSASTGDTIYDLRPGVGGGNQYICIWDTGGVDTIYAAGFGTIGPGNGAVIDLRPATLLNEIGGGGFVSYERGSNAGFTIAAGVVIENAVGWENNDIFTGNAANNTFTGKGGADVLVGGAGNDVLNGGAGADALDGGEGSDTASYAGSSAAVSINLGAGVASGGEAAGDTLSSIENVSGSAHDDTLGGDIQINQLSGGAGNDTLDGAAGADVLIGGLGDDAYIVDDVGDALTENGDEGTDTVQSSLNWTLAASFENLTLTGTATDGLGNALNNIITGNALNNILNGADGNDTINGNDGADTLNGDLGIDSVFGGAGDDTFVYAIGDGNGSIDGGADTDTLNVTDGAAGNLLNATYNSSALTALAGNGLTSVENVNANMGGGVDWLVYSAASAAVAVSLAAGSASGFASITGVERVIGGNNNDALTGDGLDNRLDGGAGDDALAGGGGIDTLLGGDGADVIAGGLANDSLLGGNGADTFSWIVGDGRDTIDGGADTDTFNALGSGVAELGNATWNGSSITALMDNALTSIETINLDLGAAIDWLIYNTAFAVIVDLSANSASGFASVSNIEKVIGGAGGDTLTGDGFDNRLDGQGGDDTLNGGAGSDSVLGGDGADVIYASAGNDSLQGLAGNDTFHWISTDGRDTFSGGADVDTVNLTGSAVADVADANWNGAAITGLLNNALLDIETINLDLGAGGSGGDWLRYNTSFGVSVDLGAGTATGFASVNGVENLIGGTGGDTLVGDGGANKINGNAGDDFITGGAGGDNLTGGLGSDTFVYAAGAGADTVVDFDAWDVGGQDFIDVTAFGIDAGNFASRVTIIDTGADTVVRIDSDVFITLKNVSGDGDNVITSADFILA